MNSQEKGIISKERKQIAAFLSAMKNENNTINEQLADIIRAVGKIRTAQLGIYLLIKEFEKKLTK